MAKVISEILFTDEEKEILKKAKDILSDISNQLDDDPLDYYQNYKYIADIITIGFNY